MRKMMHMKGTRGDDALSAASSTNGVIMDGRAGNDALTGGSGEDVLYGGSGKDFLFGGAGNDVLSGGSGNDTMVGGAGNDKLVGGDGVNQFMPGAGSNLIDVGPGIATIVSWLNYSGSGPLWSSVAEHNTVMGFKPGVDHVTIAMLPRNVVEGGLSIVDTPRGTDIFTQDGNFDILLVGVHGYGIAQLIA